MLTPVYQDWSGVGWGGGPDQGVGSKRCKCNCGGFGHQTSMLAYVMFPGWGGKPQGRIQDLKWGGGGGGVVQKLI